MNFNGSCERCGSVINDTGGSCSTCGYPHYDIERQGSVTIYRIRSTPAIDWALLQLTPSEAIKDLDPLEPQQRAADELTLISQELGLYE